MELFAGSADAYGQFVIIRLDSFKGKQEGKAQTVKAPVTQELWTRHLTTDQGIGIIPIRRDSTCVFGAIDIDDYQLDHLELLRKIKLNKFPLLVFKSKSGGAHCYCFLTEPVPALLMKEALSSFAAKLGYGGSEIFPKQVEISEKSGPGNWINMPYNKGTERPCLDDMAEPISLDTFLEHVPSQKITGMKLASFVEPDKTGDVEDKNDIMHGCILCLPVLHKEGDGVLPEGYGNDGFFMFCIMAKKKWPINWKAKAIEYHATKLKPGHMPEEERDSVIAQNEAKDYGYFCKQDKFKRVCDKANCVKTKWGPRKVDFLDWGPMSIIRSENPTYFWEINGKPVKLTAEQMMSPQLFKTEVFRQADVGIPSLEPNEFTLELNKAMSKATEIKVEKALTKKALLLDDLRSFCGIRSTPTKAQDKEAINEGFVFFDKQLMRYIFKMGAFQKYLTEHNDRIKTNELMEIVKKQWQGDAAFQKKHDLINFRMYLGGTDRPSVWSISFPDNNNIFDVEEDIKETDDNGDR